MRRLPWFILSGLAGCLGSPQYPCETDAVCNLLAGGRCAVGYCAYPNDECPSKYGYHAHAPPELAGTCVEAGEPDTAGTTDTGCVGDACSPLQCGEPLAIDFYSDLVAPRSDMALDDLFAVHLTGDEFVAVGRQREGAMAMGNFDLVALRWPRTGAAVDASFAEHQGGVDTALAIAGDGTRLLIGGAAAAENEVMAKPNQQLNKLDLGRPYLAMFADSGLGSPAVWTGAQAAEGASVIYDLAIVGGRAFGVGVLADTLWAFTFDLDNFPTQDSDLTLAEFGGLKGRLWAIAPVPGKPELLIGGEVDANAWIGRLVFDGTSLAVIEDYGAFLDDAMLGQQVQDLAISQDGARAAAVGLVGEPTDSDVWVRVFDPESREALWTDRVGVVVDPNGPVMNRNDEAHAAAFTGAGDLLVTGYFGAVGMAASDAFVVRYPAAELLDDDARAANTCVFDLGNHVEAFDIVVDVAAGEAILVGGKDDGLHEFWAHRLPLGG